MAVILINSSTASSGCDTYQLIDSLKWLSYYSTSKWPWAILFIVWKVSHDNRDTQADGEPL
ncbi:MAG: hypothetical protein R3C01_00525 [Planctomycetaceae bacterium]